MNGEQGVRGRVLLVLPFSFEMFASFAWGPTSPEEDFVSYERGVGDSRERCTAILSFFLLSKSTPPVLHEGPL